MQTPTGIRYELTLSSIPFFFLQELMFLGACNRVSKLLGYSNICLVVVRSSTPARDETWSRYAIQTMQVMLLHASHRTMSTNIKVVAPIPYFIARKYLITRSLHRSVVDESRFQSGLRT